MSLIKNTEGSRATWLGLVARHVNSLRFGVVQIVVHDSQVVQIERSEKVRLEPAEARDIPAADPAPRTNPGTRNLNPVGRQPDA